jgi:hypothetical protein
VRSKGSGRNQGVHYGRAQGLTRKEKTVNGPGMSGPLTFKSIRRAKYYMRTGKEYQ